MVVGVQTVNVNVLVVEYVVAVDVIVEVYQYQRKNLGSALASACVSDDVLTFASWKEAIYILSLIQNINETMIIEFVVIKAINQHLNIYYIPG